MAFFLGTISWWQIKQVKNNQLFWFNFLNYAKWIHVPRQTSASQTTLTRIWESTPQQNTQRKLEPTPIAEQWSQTWCKPVDLRKKLWGQAECLWQTADFIYESCCLFFLFSLHLTPPPPPPHNQSWMSIHTVRRRNICWAKWQKYQLSEFWSSSYMWVTHTHTHIHIHTHTQTHTDTIWFTQNSNYMDTSTTHTKVKQCKCNWCWGPLPQW